MPMGIGRIDQGRFESGIARKQAATDPKQLRSVIYKCLRGSAGVASRLFQRLRHAAKSRISTPTPKTVPEADLPARRPGFGVTLPLPRPLTFPLPSSSPSPSPKGELLQIRRRPAVAAQKPSVVVAPSAAVRKSATDAASQTSRPDHPDISEPASSSETPVDPSVAAIRKSIAHTASQIDEFFAEIDRQDRAEEEADALLDELLDRTAPIRPPVAEEINRLMDQIEQGEDVAETNARAVPGSDKPTDEWAELLAELKDLPGSGTVKPMAQQPLSAEWNELLTELGLVSEADTQSRNQGERSGDDGNAVGVPRPMDLPHDD